MNGERDRRLKPWQGILFFVIVMASFFTVCAWMQYNYGMLGLAGTELLLLVLAVLFPFVLRVPFKEVFPIKKPRTSRIFGTIILWIAAFLMTGVANLIVTYFFPQQVLNVSSGISQVITSVPFILSFFIVSVMPGICEEAVHRGVILSSMRSISNKAVIILIMGILFGLFHADIWRFLPTAMLGAMLSFIMIETENLVYPALFHALNNAVSLVASFSTAQTDTVQTAAGLDKIPLSSVAVYVIFSTIVPLALYFGYYLLHYEKGRAFFVNPQKRGRIQTILLVSTCSILIAGVFLFLIGILFVDQEIFQEIVRSAQT